MGGRARHPADFFDLMFNTSPDWVADLEARVVRDPGDLEARAGLVGAHRFGERGRAHALWIIENAPASEAARAVVSTPVFFSDYQGHGDVLLVWERMLAGFTGADELVGRAHLAAAYSAQHAHDAERHVRWRERARALLTDDESQLELARLEVMHLKSYEEQPAVERLVRLEEIAAHPRLHVDTLEALAAVSFEAKDATRTERYATELVQHEDPDHRALGHWLLGHLALRRNDVEGAVAHLMDTVSPEVSPKFRLARELLQRGHRDAVLRYLEALAALPQPDPWLSRLIDDVRAERTADFRPFLWY